MFAEVHAEEAFDGNVLMAWRLLMMTGEAVTVVEHSIAGVVVERRFTVDVIVFVGVTVVVAATPVTVLVPGVEERREMQKEDALKMSAPLKKR